MVSDEHFPCCEVFRNIVRNFLVGWVNDHQKLFIPVGACNRVNLWVIELALEMIP